MVEIIKRQGWTSLSPKWRTKANMADASTGHWNGPTIILSGESKWNHDKCSSVLRGIQNFHMQTQGWSDIAYNFAVCPHRKIFELRGLDIANGANGTTSGNKSSHAILFIAGEGNEFTDEERAAFVDCVNYISQNTNAPARAMGHRDHKATACPGDARYDWISKGMPLIGSSKPSTPSTPDSKGDTSAVLRYIDAVVKGIIAGEYGNGDARVTNLKKAGFNDQQIKDLQTEVNRRLSASNDPSPKPPSSSEDSYAAALRYIDSVVKGIIAGKYGNGPTRISNLKKAGFNDQQIKDLQAEVNKRLR